MGLDYSYKYEYTFNDRGIMTNYKYGILSGGRWVLAYEDELIEGRAGGISAESLLLLSLMFGQGGDSMMVIYIGLSIVGGIGGGIVIGLIIGAKKYKAY